VLADRSAVTVGNGSNCVSVCIVAKGGNAIFLRPGVKHCHAHAVIVGNNDIDGISQRRSPGADGVAGGAGIPGSAGGILHFLRSKLTNGEGRAIHFNGAVLNLGSGTIRIGTDRIRNNAVAAFHCGAQSATNATGTGNRVIMADIADCQNIADNAIAVAVDGVSMCFNVICDHLALQFSTLVGIETDIISVAVKVQRFRIQLACGAVGRLTVKPHQRLILIFNGTAFSSRRGSCRSIGRCAFRGCCGTGGTGGTTAAGSQAQGHCSCQGQR